MRASILFVLACLSVGLTAAPAPLRLEGGSFSPALRGEDARDAADALQRIATAPTRGINLIHLRLDSLPSSATPGIPSEAGWQALDQVLAAAGRQAVYVLPSLASFRQGGGAQRLALGLGGRDEGLYLADGRAREWYLYLLQQAGRRVSSVERRPYRELPQLAGWSLAADLGDAEDPEGTRAVNWALRSANLLKQACPGKLVGLQFILPTPLALAQVQALDFLIVPAAAPASLARPLIRMAPEGAWTSEAPSTLRLGVVALRMLDAHRAQLRVRSSAPARLQVDYGVDGLLKQRVLAKAGRDFTLTLTGLHAGQTEGVQVLALDDTGQRALAPLQSLVVPGESPLPAVTLPRFSGRIITAHDAKFWDGDQPFRYVGSNNYYIRYTEDPQALGRVLDAARDMGMRVLRCQANGERFEPMQSGLFEPMRNMVAGGPDGFQEPAFRRYDQVVAEAAKRGIRIIIYITDNWEYFGGMKTWVRWRGLTDKNKFYSDPRVKQDFKGLIKHWAQRVNSVSGIAYKDDPAVFAWELANEPRDEADTSSKELAGWAQEMASYWKTLDPKHMVSTGLEGARAHDGTHYSGSDFQAVQAVPAIDFACFHLYPVKDNLRYSLRAAKHAIRDYVHTAHDGMKKPVVMEEYGIEKKYDTELDRYEWISGLMQTFVDAGGDGLNQWMLVDPQYKGGDGFELSEDDTAYANVFKRLAVTVNGGSR